MNISWRYRYLIILIMGFLFTLSTPTWANPKVFVQASTGSFNDIAIHQLFAKSPELQAEIEFSGTPSNTFKMAQEQHALAFSAVENSTIAGKLVQASIEALQKYKITQVKALITIPIEMCALMNKKDVEDKKKISFIASHPAALAQITGWKKSINATELPISGGTSLAAKKVAEQTLPTGTAAIGSCGLASVYPNLSIVHQGIEENKNNNTTFLLLSVKKRTLPVSEEIAREELMAAISTGRQL